MKKNQIEVVATTDMYYLVLNQDIIFQMIPSEQNMTSIKAKAFEYCVYYGNCIPMAWVFEGTRQELEAKLKQG